MFGETYDLKKALNAYLDTSGVADPHEVARKFSYLVPEEYLRSALRQALDQYVVTLVERRRMMLADPPTAQQSAKVRAVRDAWRSALNARYHVGGGDWKFLADCTRRDVLIAAIERQEAAERIMAKAEQLKTLAQVMENADVAQVRDLPPATLASIFGGTP